MTDPWDPTGAGVLRLPSGRLVRGRSPRQPQRVEIACRGGRGRTGTALACLAIIDGVPAKQAVAFVRQHYAQHAVETPWQKRYVTRFTTPRRRR